MVYMYLSIRQQIHMLQSSILIISENPVVVAGVFNGGVNSGKIKKDALFRTSAADLYFAVHDNQLYKAS